MLENVNGKTEKEKENGLIIMKEHFQKHLHT